MKKAIIVASFGTSYEKSLKNSIESIEKNIENNFKDYEVYRAFTSHMVIRKIFNNTGEKILTLEEVLENLVKDNYEEVIIQPTHVIPGEEYDYLKNVTSHFKSKFERLKLGRPIFFFKGEEPVPDDYTEFVRSIKDILVKNQNVILIGHGTTHIASAVYSCLQLTLEDEGFRNVLVGTIEGYPSMDSVIRRVKEKNITEVLLMPLMVVAGDHVLNDIASDEDDSWKTILQEQGIKAEVYFKGLGEIETFRQLYINRIEDVISGKYEGIGKTKKGRKHGNSNNFIKL